MDSPKRRKPGPYLALIILVLAILYLVYKNIVSSVFLKNSDKINILFYGPTPRLYSLDSLDTDYLITFSPEARVLVPGGYGYYRIGSLNRLVNLEKKPELYVRTFSVAISAFVDLYFYPGEDKIYYKEDKNPEPALWEILTYRSNATILDRILVAVNFLNRGSRFRRDLATDDSFVAADFAKDHIGTFYKKTYRKNLNNVQILYDKNYRAAELVSHVIDGEGIRVVDISGSGSLKCHLIARITPENREAVSGLQRFFRCPVTEGNPPVSDIILDMGQTQTEWAEK